MKSIPTRLSVLNFLEFAVWGAYLTSMGNFLWRASLAEDIFWFYAVQGLASLFMPALIGYLADSIIAPRKMLSICHFLSATMKSLALYYCISSPVIKFWPLFILFGLGVSFYIPTIGLNNAYVMGCLKKNGFDPVKMFPKVRVFGTIGFITAMLMVNFIPFEGVSLQASPWQLGLSACFSMVLAIYILFLPKSEKPSGDKSDTRGSYCTLLKDKNIFCFLIFTFLISICLQITNSYCNPYISSFATIPEFAGSWGARNANAIISLSQLSEALFVLLVPLAMKWFDIKKILIIAATAWTLRFGFLAIGNTNAGIIALIVSMIVYGIAFDFVNITGAIYLDSCVDKSLKNRVQSLFMLVMSGMGATIGTPIAGWVVNSLVYSRHNPELQQSGWQQSWFIFAAYSFIIALLIYFVYPSISRTNRDTEKQKRVAKFGTYK